MSAIMDPERSTGVPALRHDVICGHYAEVDHDKTTINECVHLPDVPAVDIHIIYPHWRGRRGGMSEMAYTGPIADLAALDKFIADLTEARAWMATELGVTT